MSTSVTKKTLYKGSLLYLGISLFCVLFSIIYERLSYGEFSFFMRTLFVAPFMGFLLLYLQANRLGWLQNKLSLRFYHSANAIFVSGSLIKGIIEISGRTTSIDYPYWIIGSFFILLSFFVGLGKRKF